MTTSIYKFTFSTSGFQFGPTPQANQYQTQNNYNFVDNLSWVRGRHTFTFGGQYVRVSLNKQFPQVFNGQLFFTNTTGSTDFGNFVGGTPEFSFGGGGVYNHAVPAEQLCRLCAGRLEGHRESHSESRPANRVPGRLDGWRLPHWQHGIEISPSPELIPSFIPVALTSWGFRDLTGNAAGSTFRNSVSTGWGPRVGFAWDVSGRGNTTLRGGYGIYYVREDVGAVDQLSFQSPFIPIVFFGQTPGFDMSDFFTGTPATNANAVPPAGTLSAAWLPCLARLTSFPDTNGAATYGGCTGPGVNSTQNLFVLEVPRHFVVPNTQQWNLTLQRELGKNWVLEVGYVGTHAIHLRETRDAIQSVDASPAHPFTVTDTNGNSYQITTNTFANAIARTPAPGLNGYSGYQIFANDAYSTYNALQATASRRWGQNYRAGRVHFLQEH